MTRFEYRNSERIRKCRICSKNILDGEKGLVLEDVHVSPSYHDLWFHEECFEESIKKAKEERDERHTTELGTLRVLKRDGLSTLRIYESAGDTGT